mgnify:CR=1 FL=1
MDKDMVANIFTLGGLTFSMAQIQTSLTILILITALVLNVQRIIANFKKKKDQQD